jgi:hypothetical protein
VSVDGLEPARTSSTHRVPRRRRDRRATGLHAATKATPTTKAEARRDARSCTDGTRHSIGTRSGPHLYRERGSMATPASMNPFHDVRHRRTPERLPHSSRQWQPRCVSCDRIEVSIFDDVLRANLPGLQSSATDPAPNRLRVAAGSTGSLRDGQHVVRCYNIRSAMLVKAQRPESEACREETGCRSTAWGS